MNRNKPREDEMTYDGPERGQSVRWKSLSSEEIDMYLKGELKDIHRLILLSLNRLGDAYEMQMHKLDRHQRREDDWMGQIDEIGGFESIKKRADFTDKAILKLEEETDMLRAAKKKIMLGGIGAILFALGCVLVHFWNGHAPASMQLPMPKP